MAVTYSFTVDLGFYRTSFRRYWQQNPNRLRYQVTFAVLVVVAAGSWLYFLETHMPWVVIPMCAATGGLIGGAAGVYLMGVLALNRLKRGPEFGAELTVVLDDDGLSATVPNATVKIAWNGFTRCVRFPDGIMLLRGRIMRWLPDSGLQSVSPIDAITYVRSKTQLIDVG